MYDHYIALDWAQTNMAIARMTGKTDKISVTDVPASVKEFKGYLGRLKGSVVLTFEETTTAQWLFTELSNHVDKIIVCDPFRNKLLNEGAKTDRIDAKKLVTLLKAGLLKPVFHSCDKFISYRKLTSGYKDLVVSGVRLKNQRAALFRAVGKHRRSKTIVGEAENFVLEGIHEAIELYERRKALYEKKFSQICKKHPMARNLLTIPGIGVIGAVKIVAIVVSAGRFPKKNHFLSYSGLVKHELLSGGRSYGRRTPRCCRELKSIFKIGALACIAPNVEGPLKQYYQSLIENKTHSEHMARHAVARRLATIVYGVLKTERKFDPKRLKTS